MMLTLTSWIKNLSKVGHKIENSFYLTSQGIKQDITFSDGSRYKGETLNGMKDGYGILEYNEGSR